MDNVKLGIVTFHNAHNYGAVLQAYGLHRKLSLLDVKSEFIQDANDPVGKKYQLFPHIREKGLVQYLKSWIVLLLDYKRKVKRASAFDSFIVNYLPSYDLKNGSTKYSHVVLGSDQIWNFNITNGLQNIYFGEDENIKSGSVFSYAASMGNGMVDPNFTTEYKSKLTKLKSIGVREKSLGDEIKSKYNLETTINVDPTLLLEKEEWDQLIPKNELSNTPYILVYEVEKNVNTPELVRYIKSKLGLEVKVLSSKIMRKESKANITTASPEEFLGLFKNASFVVTTSFHGTVFSLINEVPFYTVKFNSKVDLRSAGLLESVGLTERHINDVNDVITLELNFIEAREKLAILRAKSTDYLVKNIKNSSSPSE